MKNSAVTKAYIVSGLPHILLGADKSPAWKKLHDSYGRLREEIGKSDADLILYFSTQWLSVLGYLFQADPEPTWVHVDPNWHELGTMEYKFKVDVDFAKVYSQEVSGMGHYTRLVNYRGFPIDTGIIVAQKLLNPDNRLPAAMVSCNMYAEKQETLSIGQAGTRALSKAGKRAVVVCVSNLSNRFEVHEIDPREDKISSLKDDEWNRKILELLGEGRLEDVSEVAREFSRQANADMGCKGIWWLNGLCGKSNAFSGQVYDYQPVWGTGAALVGLAPTQPIRPIAGWSNEEFDITERAHLTVDRGVKNRQSTTSTRLESPLSPPADKDSAGDEKIISHKAPEPVGPYPHARRHGDLLFLSGVGPRKRGTKEIPGVRVNEKGDVIGHDIEVQTRSVVENVTNILLESGSSLENVIDVQVFLTDMKRDFQTFNRVYGEYFKEIGPTRTTVEVNSLPTPIAVEFKVVARAD